MAPTNRKIVNYPEERMQAAINGVLKGGLSKREAAKKYAIPRTTLMDKLSGRYREGKSIGRDPFLTKEEEESIVKYVNQ